MKTHGLFIALISSSAILACGGSTADDDEAKRPVDYCYDACEEAADCDTSAVAANCKQGCDDLAQEARSAGCQEELGSAMRCFSRNYQCDSVAPQCESALEDFIECSY